MWQCSQGSVTKTKGYGNYVELQEAGGSLRLHNSIIQGNIGQIRPHLRNCDRKKLNTMETYFHFVAASLKSKTFSPTTP